MSRAITKKILVITILFISIKVNAQQWLGRTTGNYSGTYGLYNNASSIADSRYRYYFNFWGRGVNFYNNNMLYNAPFKINQWANGTYDPAYKGINGKPDFQKGWLMEDLNGKTKQFSFNQDIWGPSFMFPIARKVNMSINTRQRNSLQIFGINEPLARMAYHGLDSSGGIYNGSKALNRNTFYTNGKFGANAQSYQELSFSLAGIIVKNENHQLTGGATVKFIRGLGAAYVKGKGFDLSATGNNTAHIQNADIQYAYTDDKSVVAPFNKPYDLFSLQSNGGGAGIDLGLTYTYTAQRGKYATSRYCNDNNNKSDYDFKLAAAFNDIGGIRYNQGAVKYSYSASNPINVNASANILNGFNQTSQNAFDTIGQNIFGQLSADKKSGFSTSLPTAFNLQTDFRLSKHFYTSVYWNQSLKRINSTGMKSTSILSVIPRFESRGVEFSMPLSLSENYKNFNVGAYLRFGPVFFGSDNLGGLINAAGNNQFRGADIYGGISFGIGHCNKWVRENKVEPNHIDTVKQVDTIKHKDTIKTERKDTIEIIRRDTVKIKVHDTIYIKKQGEIINKVIHDTLYIEKTIRTKADIERETELNKKEQIILIRQRQLDQREKDLLEKEKGTYDENEALKKCKTETTILSAENISLKNKVINQADEIIRLQKQIEDLNRNKTILDAEIVKIKTDKAKADNDAVFVRKKADSLQNKLDVITINLNNCKKNNGVTNDAEIVKAKADKTKAENDATTARRKADSLQNKLDFITIDLNNCKKNNGSTNDAEIIKAKADKAKAENDAIIARKKSDSLQAKLDGIVIDLDACKKGNALNDATIVKLKKTENDRDLYKSELDGANKTNFTLNAKIYKLNATIDSLINALTDCGKGENENDAAFLKKCNAAKAEMDAEVTRLKNIVSAVNRSLDSIKNITDALKKDKVTLDAQIVELNARIKAGNCDELSKEIEEKNKTIGELKVQNSTLQAKVNTLTNQLNEQKAAYELAYSQNQDCNKKLDSCMRGLLNHKEIDKTPSDDKEDKGIEKGGPHEGSIDRDNDDNSISTEKIEKSTAIVNAGLQILKAIINSNNSVDSNPPVTKPSGTSTPSGTDKTNTEKNTNTGRNTAPTNTTPQSSRRR